ncbi:DUF4276 family protein [Dolichospermum sp. ST_con]|nr:DUF4276 family protein [Dolichospermum sp. ST_con]MDD1419162.1 DUF4276 family protein [Dolichospermum sp. ST_sed1]MDD1425430.1 DUF4276 family protein [Dolichospermum sp. ST_sed9]MDD1432107.1 DUF4276 family protein [Dolichospermum sp. ST_sed6]MDD1435572.1 DUF4276 family protein [Dolichospermum sp. ST_sed10]MDD1441384.1 DUF4276 family protein [Dolichospermum sp. ST_sed3]MDD1447179.1 DUF4276 family protein [Dolichospermum sp. ST_sed8]MDD1454248.1 DUF4276 family protein [Dolichospermum sp. ST
MKKLAIFVEGKTEQIFVAKLLKEIAGKFKISIEIKSRQGINFDKVIMKDPVTFITRFYVLIYNSCRDESVISDIKEQYNLLAEDGYDRVIGLRDVYPISISDKSKLQRGLNYALPVRTIPINIVLAVMEVESWFLAEYNHFLKIDPRLTPEKIQAMFGFNPRIDDMEQRPHPTDDMEQIYNYVHKGYNKSEKQLNRLASNLDYEFLYMHLANSVPSLGEFMGYIDKFMISS